MGRGGASTPLITTVARSTLGQNRTRMYTGASHTNNNLSPDFPVSDHDHPDNRVQHQRDSSSEPTEVIVDDPQIPLVESWMKFRNGNWSAMSPWHGPPLGTIKFRCHPHPPPLSYHRHASPHPPRHFCISGKMHQPALFRKKFHNKKLKPMLHKSNV